MTEKRQDIVLDFPCEFPIKIIGKSSVEFEACVVGIIRKHAPKIPENAFVIKPSKEGKYTAITATITAENQNQIDAIYQDLTNAPEVLMAL